MFNLLPIDFALDFSKISYLKDIFFYHNPADATFISFNYFANDWFGKQAVVNSMTNFLFQFSSILDVGRQNPRDTPAATAFRHTSDRMITSSEFQLLQ